MLSKQATGSHADRIRAILGLASDDPIPRVRRESLKKYHTYLAVRLAFPFAAKLARPVHPSQDTEAPLSVVRLLDPNREYHVDGAFGLVCKTFQGREPIDIPLDRVDVDPDHPNYQLLEDYRSWFQG